jgi:hypothetical protein
MKAVGEAVVIEGAWYSSIATPSYTILDPFGFSIEPASFYSLLTFNI